MIRWFLVYSQICVPIATITTRIFLSTPQKSHAHSITLHAFLWQPLSYFLTVDLQSENPILEWHLPVGLPILEIESQNMSSFVAGFFHLA